MNYIYISKYPESVFDSQVLELIEELRANTTRFKKFFLLIGVDPLKKNKISTDTKQLREYEDDNFKIITFNLFPFYPILNFLSAISLFFSIRKLDIDNPIIHIRDESISSLLSVFISQMNIRTNQVLVDVRASNIEEIEIYKRDTMLTSFKLFTKRKFLFSLKKFKYVSVVSSELRNYVISRINYMNDIFIVHSVAGRRFIFSQKWRKEIRSAYGIREDEVVFVFSSGGQSKWQKTEFIIEQISKLGYRIINLSKREIVKENVINKFVPFNEVPKYLCAADIGVIWRDDNIVNNVASPVKFSEYICCGLPVICNDSVKLISQFIEEHDIGAIIENINQIAPPLVQEIKHLDRKRIAEIGKKKFGIQETAQKYLDIYDQLIT